MPSTYTDNSGIELPANGEQSGTWGETVNDNMNIIDRLSNGIGTISLSGTSHSLVTSDGVLSDGQYNTLLLSGSPSGTNTITISPNSNQHIYTVINSSGQDAVFTQGSGANITVKNGSTKIIYADGAGSGAAVVDITNTLDINALHLAGVAVTSTAAELNILDGVTSTTAELNILDGATLDVNELNILDGATVTTAELNVLDGIPATLTATELGYVDGVTSSIQTQLNNLLTGPSITSPVTVTGGTSSWVLTASGTTLTFSYNGVPKVRFDGSTGDITATGNITAYGSL